MCLLSSKKRSASTCVSPYRASASCQRQYSSTSLSLAFILVDHTAFVTAWICSKTYEVGAEKSRLKLVADARNRLDLQLRLLTTVAIP